MELHIEQGPTRNGHKRYALPDGTPDSWKVYLDEPTTWGLLTLHDRTWKSVGAIVAGAIRRELNAHLIDTAMTPAPETWRTRLAYWLLRREARRAEAERRLYRK